MKNCHYCGVSIANNAKICKNCGKQAKVEKISTEEAKEVHEEQFQYDYVINSAERKNIKDKESFDKSTTFRYSFRLRFGYLFNILYCLLGSFYDKETPYLYFLLFIICIIFGLPYYFNRVYLGKQNIYIVEKDTIFSEKKIIGIPYKQIDAGEVYNQIFTRHIVLIGWLGLYKNGLKLYLKGNKDISIHFLRSPSLLLSKLIKINTKIQEKR